MRTWEDRMVQVEEMVRIWRAVLMDPLTPEPRSSLAADDRVHPQMPCSQLAWWGLHVGVEHLDAALRLLKQQVAEGGPILPSANFTVLRGGLVGASQAVVLLLPTNRTERTTYGLQIAHEEYRQAANFRGHVETYDGMLGGVSLTDTERKKKQDLENAKDEVAALLKTRGAVTRLTDTAMIERAAQLVHPEGEGDAELLAAGVNLEWRLGSGSAHGRLLMSLHRPDGHQKQSGNRALMGATFEQVAYQVAGVSLLLNEAWRSWDLRRT